MSKSQRDQLLARINQHLPKNVDWKQGAIDYLESLASDGEHQKLYHYIKPFIGGPDFSDFFLDMLSFVNAVQQLDLPMKSKFIDVACGSGWTSLYLAKLGHEVCGFDIAKDLIEIAKEKTRTEKYGVYPGEPLKADFHVHDIENAPMDVKDFDCAVLFSALHHFYNPIDAIANIAKSLKDEGIIYVWEAVGPEPGTPWFRDNMEIMENHHTIERPYSHNDVVEMFEMAGFKHYEFYSEINGLYNVGHSGDVARLENDATRWKTNICFIASRKPDFFVNSGRYGTGNIEAIEKTNLLNSLMRSPTNKPFFDTIYTVYKMYEKYFGSVPNPEEILYWDERLGAGETGKESDFVISTGEVYSNDNKRLHLEGWSEVDATGTVWSLDYSSKLYFYASKQGQDLINQIALRVGTNGQQSLSLRLNGKKVYSGDLDDSDQELLISGEEILEGVNQLEFAHPDAKSPGIQDYRLLAIQLITIKFN